MNIHYKHAQFELFPNAPGKSRKHGKSKFLFSSVTLSSENIVILIIFIVMAMVFSFSLGSERGKKINSHNETATAPKGNEEVKSITDVKALDSDLEAVDEQVVLISSDEDGPIKSFTDSRKNSRIGDSLNHKKSQVDIESAYTVQVASFRKSEYAQTEAEKIGKNLPYEVFVISKGDYSVVCVGKFSGKDKTAAAISKLKRRYKDCLVRRL